MKFNNETELARLVVIYLTDLHWKVYQEVQPSPGGPCADIVATQGPLIWVIETKLTFGLSVIEQAHYWLNRAHLVSVATPRVKNDRMARLVCQQFGIGHLHAVEADYTRQSDLRWTREIEIAENLPPRLHRTARINAMKRALIPERQTYAEAGNNRGERLTAFGLTCNTVRRFVAEHPDCTVRELVDGIKTHYKTPSSARNSLAMWIRAGKVSGVCLVDGRLKQTSVSSRVVE